MLFERSSRYIDPDLIDVNAAPRALRPSAFDPTTQKTVASYLESNLWCMFLGPIGWLLSRHTTHVEFRHKTGTAAYVKKWMCCSCCCNSAIAMDFKDIPETTISNCGLRPRVVVRGPGSWVCDPECGDWTLDFAHPYDADEQERLRLQWDNYIERIHKQFRAFKTEVPR